MFEQLRRSLNDLLERATKPEDRREVVSRMKLRDGHLKQLSHLGLAPQTEQHVSLLVEQPDDLGSLTQSPRE